MSKAKLAVVVASMAIGAALGLWASPAQCAFCSPGICFNSSSCGRGCVCIKRALEPMGKCYSVD